MPDVEGSFRPRLPGYGPFLPNGAVVVPLSEALFVDPGTLVPAEDQNGTPGAPFTAIQTAVDALAAKVQGTIVLAPGVYPAEAVVVGATNLTLLGLGSAESGCDLALVTVGAAGRLSIANVAAMGAITGADLVALRASSCLGAIAGNALQVDNCTAADLTATTTARLDGVVGGASVSCVELFANNCTLAGITLTGPGTSVLTATSYNALSGPAFAVIDCDAFSEVWTPASGGCVRNLISPTVSLVVAVPVLAVGVAGAAAPVLLTGTVLEGTPVDRRLVASEPTAGVAGGGFLAGVRMSADNTVLFTFCGPTTGGDQTFQVTEI